VAEGTPEEVAKNKKSYTAAIFEKRVSINGTRIYKDFFTLIYK